MLRKSVAWFLAAVLVAMLAGPAHAVGQPVNEGSAVAASCLGVDPRHVLLVTSTVSAAWANSIPNIDVRGPKDPDWAAVAADKKAIWIDTSVLGKLDQVAVRALLEQGKFLYFYGAGVTKDAVARALNLDLPFEEKRNPADLPVAWGVKLLRKPGVYHTAGVFARGELDDSHVLSALQEHSALVLRDCTEKGSQAGIAARSDWPLEHSASYTWYYSPYGKFTMYKKLYHCHNEQDTSRDYWATEDNSTTEAGYSVYGSGWLTDYLWIKDKIEANPDGGTNRVVDHDPQNTSSSSTASVSFSAGSASLSWSFPTNGTTITNQSSLPNYGKWAIGYNLRSSSAMYTQKTSPGIEATVEPEGTRFSHTYSFTVRFYKPGVGNHDESSSYGTTLYPTY